MMQPKASTSGIPFTPIENVNEQIITNYFLQQPAEIKVTPELTTKEDVFYYFTYLNITVRPSWRRSTKV